MADSSYIPRVFVDAVLGAGKTVDVNAAKRHHLGTVLRLGQGAPVALFNGDGAEYAARVTRASRKTMRLTIEAVAYPRRESPLHVTLVQGVARGGRMDIAIAKAVELGVAAIQPVYTARGRAKLAGERLAKKQAHWQNVAESAAEQSGRLIRPAVAPAAELSVLLAAPRDAATARLVLAPAAARRLADCAAAKSVVLLVGPESGLATDEIEAAAARGWTPLALGPRILRTETAGMAALAAIQTRWGDLGV